MRRNPAHAGRHGARRNPARLLYTTRVATFFLAAVPGLATLTNLFRACARTA